MKQKLTMMTKGGGEELTKVEVSAQVKIGIDSDDIHL